MGATNKTPNIELPQFVGTDKPSWLGDFNGAMNTIDVFAGKTTGDIGTVTATANAAKAAADAAGASVATLETTVAQHTTEISDVMADVSGLEADVAQINTSIENINTFDSMYEGNYEVYNPTTKMWEVQSVLGAYTKGSISIVVLGGQPTFKLPIANAQNSTVFRVGTKIGNVNAVASVLHGQTQALSTTPISGVLYQKGGDAVTFARCGWFYNTSDNYSYFFVPAGNLSSVTNVSIPRIFAISPATQTVQVYVG